MKKVLIVAVSAVVAIMIVLACIGIYFINMPEYTLMKIMKDVNEAGIDGLRPHLTENAQAAVDTISSIAESELAGSIIGLFGESEYLNILRSEVQNVQWKLEDIMKGKNNAAVILAFNYRDKLTGSIELAMIRVDGDWKIDGLKFPEFDEIDW